MEFTQEVIGAESYLVYHLQKEETVDSFLKGMLQNNEIHGILKPSFSQKDMEQYIKYSVTSKIPLSEWMARRLKKEKVLTLFASILSAIEDAEEYMITVDKLLLDPVHIYIDVSSMNAFLVCLPLEGIDQEKQGTDLLKEILFDSTYEEWEDLSYVGRIIDYLNKNKNGPTKKLLQFFKDLSGTGASATSVPAVPKEAPHSPYQEISPRSSDRHTVDHPERYVRTPLTPIQEIPPTPLISTIPSEPTIEMPRDTPVKNKGIALFGNGKKQKQADPSSGILIPGMAIPGMEGPGGMASESPIPAGGLAGAKSFPPTTGGPKGKKKKEGGFGLFRGKKKEGSVMPEPAAPVPSPVGYSYGGASDPVPPSVEHPVRAPRTDLVMAGSDENMEDEERTIIMGGGVDEERTQLLGSGSDIPRGKADTSHMVASLTRRRNGQRIALTKAVSHIGKESSFADLYIGDNPAISSAHADIVLSDGIYYIRDMNSLNHTYVNQTMIMPNRLVPLYSGDVIKMANEDFDFVIGS